MKRVLFIVLGLGITFSFSAMAKKKKTIYKYKKHETFNFDALDIEGADSSPGDISAINRHKRKFKNKIPERKNFNRQLKNAVDSIL